MTDYQAINPYHMGVNLGVAALFYASARYAKVKNVGKASMGVALAAITQGMQPKANDLLGHLNYQNGILDLTSLVFIIGGGRITHLAIKIQFFVGSALCSSLIAIRFIYRDTFEKRLKRLDTPAAREECKVLFLKTCSMTKSHEFRNSSANEVSKLWYKFLIQDPTNVENAKGYTEFIEVLNSQKVINPRLFRDEGLGCFQGEGEEHIDQWMLGRGNTVKEAWEKNEVAQ